MRYIITLGGLLAIYDPHDMFRKSHFHSEPHTAHTTKELLRMQSRNEFLTPYEKTLVKKEAEKIRKQRLAHK